MSSLLGQNDLLQAVVDKELSQQDKAVLPRNKGQQRSCCQKIVRNGLLNEEGVICYDCTCAKSC